MIDFLKESDTFAGVTFSGFYTMSLSDLDSLYNHYKETGENLLDDYSNVIYMTWEVDEYPQKQIDHKDYNQKMISISNMRRVGFFDPEEMRELKYNLNIALENYVRWKKRNSTKKVLRRKASGYTSKPEIREIIFEKYGEACLKCGSEDDIQLDHVIPVRKGGKNSIDNLQPLCKSCNVSKGIKIRDYRNGL